MQPIWPSTAGLFSAEKKFCVKRLRDKKVTVVASHVHKKKKKLPLLFLASSLFIDSLPLPVSGQIVKHTTTQALDPGTYGADGNCGYGGQQEKRPETAPTKICHGRWDEGLVLDWMASPAKNSELAHSEDAVFLIEKAGDKKPRRSSVSKGVQQGLILMKAIVETTVSVALMVKHRKLNYKKSTELLF